VTTVSPLPPDLPVVREKLRIFNINVHRHWNGQVYRVFITSKLLAERGHHVVVGAPRGSMLAERARAAGLEVFDALTLSTKFIPHVWWKDYWALRALFRREKFDVIHTHGSEDTWLSCFAARATTPRIPVVRTRHNSYRIRGHVLNRWLYRSLIDQVVVVAAEQTPRFVEAGVLGPDALLTIHDGIDSSRFEPGPGREEVRAELGIPQDAPLILCVARLAPEKGHRFLLAAAPAIAAKHPETRYLFPGVGITDAPLLQQAKELGLADKVILPGHRDDVVRLLRAADLFALVPVDGETLGTSILEALSVGLPVIATDVGGVKNVVRDGQTGLLLPPGDSDAIAAAVLRLFGDPALAQRLARTGQDVVRREFTQEHMVDQKEALYRRVIAQARAGAGPRP
jgi:glycosyltransferase involved in cell wall biosynthesis